jgi:hypothetical protein
MLALPMLVLVGSCSDGDDDASLTMSDLREAGSTCPADLDGAVVEAGLTEDGNETEAAVEVSEGSGDGGRDDTAIDQVGGVYVECTRPVEDGTAMVVVFASERPAAVELLIPLMSRDLELSSDDLHEVVTRYVDTGVGELVDLGIDGPAALGRIEVDDAESAVLYVSIPEASADQVRAIAEDLVPG